jgi:hypothetical protein
MTKTALLKLTAPDYDVVPALDRIASTIYEGGKLHRINESWRIRIAAGEIKRLRAALKRMNRQLQAAQK